MAEVRVPTMPHGHSLEKDVDYRAGVVAGLLGAIISGLFVMIVTSFTETDFFFLAKLTSGLVVSEEIASGAIGIIIGLGIVLFVGVVFGIGFGMLFTLLTNSYALIPTLVLGLIYGFGLWFLSFLVTGPVAGTEIVDMIGPAIALPAYLIMGLVLSVCYREFRTIRRT